MLSSLYGAFAPSCTTPARKFLCGTLMEAPMLQPYLHHIGLPNFYTGKPVSFQTCDNVRTGCTIVAHYVFAGPQASPSITPGFCE